MSKEKPDVWFPLMVSAYLKKTMGLTTEQHGAYLLLLIHYWVEGPPLDDNAMLAAVTRLDTKRWRACRPVMLRYFRIEDGHWRQDRADEELVRWAERKRKFAERGAAGGRAKAAKNPALSTLEAQRTALLTGYPSSPSGEVEGPNGPSTLSGQNENLVGKRRDFRDDVVALKGEEYARSWLDPSHWQDIPEPAIVCRLTLTAKRLSSDLKALLKAHGVKVRIEGEVAA